MSSIDENHHVVILGNGFDKFIGRPTSYAEFYNSDFCPKNYPAPLIHFLNGISADGKAKNLRWYDFENELLDYVTNSQYQKEPLSSTEKAVLKQIIKNGFFNAATYTEQGEQEYKAYDSLVNKKLIFSPPLDLKIHFAYEHFYDDIIERDKYAFSLIKDGLTSYFNSFPPELVNLEALEKVKQLLHTSNIGPIVVYTFNYTSIPSLGINYVNFVHGSCEKNNIILGTREEKAIEKNYWYLQKIFDINYKPEYVLSDLFGAARVTIFGHSLGENDRQYFEAFFKRQCNPEKAQKDLPITIYTKDQESVMEIKHSLQELTDYHLSDLYQNSRLEIIATESFQ